MNRTSILIYNAAEKELKKEQEREKLIEEKPPKKVYAKEPSKIHILLINGN